MKNRFDERGPWLPDFDVRMVQIMGHEWPDAVIVEKWERNRLGERRYVESRPYIDNDAHTPKEPDDMSDSQRNAEGAVA